MIGETSEKRGNEPLSHSSSGLNRPHIDPKDYVLSEEAIEALTELAMLVREIKVQQALEQADAAIHHENETSNRNPYSASRARRRVS
ncbi:hypothetical protein [Kordiimonas marina]|uniref:hypothetical protein n=1 Tax=Kordiimonas marina TaxID=2872312 RepID=UPI001FF3D279|nr:hypothetical protein [Kordiimonas marina]MCJ9430739.1 hypothetical protein [Kordiimonas marina]